MWVCQVDTFQPLELSRYDHSSDILCPKEEKGDIITDIKLIFFYFVLI